MESSAQIPLPPNSVLNQVFCCPQVLTAKKNNIPPYHPLHQLLAHLIDPETLDNGALPGPPSITPGSIPTSQESIPGPNECVVILISDPRSSRGNFNARGARSRMFCGRRVNSTWEWREKLDARNNVGGILREVDGDMEGRLRKEMTACFCAEHGWRYTMVVLIGVDQEREEREAERRRGDERDMLLRMAADAGTRAGAREGAPAVPPQCSPQ